MIDEKITNSHVAYVVEERTYPIFDSPERSLGFHAECSCGCWVGETETTEQEALEGHVTHVHVVAALRHFAEPTAADGGEYTP